MFLCLSSFLSPIYGFDILRALALPRGGLLQFRYADKWLSDETREWAQGVLASGNERPATTDRRAECLIAYIDQQDKSKLPVVVPCRTARIERILKIGTTWAFEMSVEDFAIAENRQEFNDTLRTKHAASVPNWENDKIVGKYWFSLTALDHVRHDAKIETFEQIVKQLAVFPDFKEIGLYYHISGVRQVATTTFLALKDGRYELKPNTTFEILLYHFHPTDPVSDRLELKSSTDAAAVAQRAQLAFSSRYDITRVRFRTANPAPVLGALRASFRGDAPANEGALTFYRTLKGRPDQLWDLDLPVSVRSDLRGPFVTGLGIAVSLIAPQLILAFSNEKLEKNGYLIPAVIAVVVFNAIVGMLTAFGLKR